jgi:hypothetical protein
MNGSLQLSEYPGEMVRLSCEKCGRSGQYRKQKLIERYGADMRGCRICARKLRAVTAWAGCTMLVWLNIRIWCRDKTGVVEIRSWSGSQIKIPTTWGARPYGETGHDN